MTLSICAYSVWYQCDVGLDRDISNSFRTQGVVRALRFVWLLCMNNVGTAIGLLRCKRNAMPWLFSLDNGAAGHLYPFPDETFRACQVWSLTHLFVPASVRQMSVFEVSALWWYNPPSMLTSASASDALRLPSLIF